VIERDYLSIGEVLAQLLEEFPDVTISKIRFLESQGLIEPERTPSGYRKFTSDEVERLRFILREQKTSYLPLRIIKDRLEDESQDISREVSVSAEMVSASSHPAARSAATRRISRGDILDQDIPSASVNRELRKMALKHADSTESIPRDLLLKQLPIEPAFLKELEQVGLVSGHEVGDTTFFDPHSLEVARTAGRFKEMGIDIRHLRAWKTSADRELSLFEQRILPLLRQRNPAARDEAINMLAEFMELGTELRNALLMREISRLTEQR